MSITHLPLATGSFWWQAQMQNAKGQLSMGAVPLVRKGEGLESN